MEQNENDTMEFMANDCECECVFMCRPKCK